jgi:hypothetical protein
VGRARESSTTTQPRRVFSDTWNTSQIVGLPAPSLKTSGTTAPSLIILPYHQAGSVASIRQFTNNALNHHHGMQSEERFGLDADPDGDGFTNELTVADVTAISLYQATLPVPGRVIPNDPAAERANRSGEAVFKTIGCATCHATPPLTPDNNPGLPGRPGWIYFEPDPYNPNTGPIHRTCSLDPQTIRSVLQHSLWI